MKNVILTLCLIATFAIADGWKFPGWNVTDAAVWQEAVATAQRPNQLETATYMLAITQNPPVNFEAAKATITAALQGLDCDEAKILERVKQHAYCTGKFLPETIAYAKANPCPYDYYLAQKDNTDWGYQIIKDSLLSKPILENEVIRAIENINLKAVQLDKDDAEMLDFFTRLNRVYSAKLVKDKEKWSPVVAQIRTLMETYE